MLEKKKCVICNNDVIVHNCHYKCDNCGMAENCHDIPHIIKSDSKNKTNKL